MNKWDKNNFDFIMSLSSRDFEEWYVELSDDDIQYAIELMNQARLELAMDAVENVSEAANLLKKYTLKGN